MWCAIIRVYLFIKRESMHVMANSCGAAYTYSLYLAAFIVKRQCNVIYIHNYVRLNASVERFKKKNYMN